MPLLILFYFLLFSLFFFFRFDTQRALILFFEQRFIKDLSL